MRFTIKRAHRKIVVVSVVNRKLLFKIVKRVKRMCSIKIFVIFAVRALNLSVMSRCVGLYEFVPYATLFDFPYYPIVL